VAELEKGEELIHAQQEAATRELQSVREVLAQAMLQQRAVMRGLKLPRPSLLAACDMLPHHLSEPDQFSLCYFITHGGSVYMAGACFPMLALDEIKALIKHHRPEKRHGDLRSIGSSAGPFLGNGIEFHGGSTMCGPNTLYCTEISRMSICITYVM
jgi:hypothetical protein